MSDKGNCGVFLALAFGGVQNTIEQILNLA